MSGASRTTPPVVPERFGWSLKVLLVLAALYAVVAVGTLIAQVVQLVLWAQPGARVPVSMDTSYTLPTNGLRNEYGGVPFVRDGVAVVATHVSTTLNDVPLAARVAVGISPLLWTCTALLVTIALAVTLRRLAAGASFGRDAAQPVVVAAAGLAVGSSLAQIVQAAAGLGVSEFAWAAPATASRLLGRVDYATFQFAPLVAACGLLAVALLLRRGRALQQDVDGLV